MGNRFRRSLLFCIPLLVTACGDYNPPTIPVPGIATAAMSPTSVTLSWTKATDTRSDPAALVYKVYMSGANPAYQSFNTIEKVEAGTLVQTLNNANSLTISSGIVAGNAYYFNIVVLDEKGNKALYDPLGEFFHNNLVYYYPFSGNGNDVAATANHLVVATPLTQPVLTLDRFSHTASAYNFNSTTPQCLQSTNPLGANFTGNHSRTVSLWVKSANASSASRVAFSWGNGPASGSTFGFLDGGTASNWTVWLSGTSDVLTNTAVTTNWEHWVVMYDSVSNLIYTYKNGVVVNDGVIPSPALNTLVDTLYVGCGMNSSVLSYPYNGVIDDVRIFDQLLTTTEVTRLFTVTRP